MRAFFLLVLIAGAALGIAYPWAIQNFSGHELGVWRVYDEASGFRPVDVTLDWSAAPLRVLVDLTSAFPPAARGDSETVLTITASIGGRTVLAETLNFVDAPIREDTPQTVEKIYRDDAGTIAKLDSGIYRFTLGPGDAQGISIKAVDLILRSGAMSYDERAQPIGFTLMAFGFIGFVLSLRRGPGGRNAEPPPPRWGRQGGEGP